MSSSLSSPGTVAPGAAQNSTAHKVALRTAALHRLQQARGVVVGTHSGPDADGIGAGLALVLGLRALGKSAWFALEEPLDPRTEFLGEVAAQAGDDLIRVGEEVLSIGDKADLTIVVDTARLSAQSTLARWTRIQRADVLIVDHHLGSRRTSLAIVVTTSASSGEVVCAILEALGAPIGPQAAHLMYCATSYDTGSFRFLRAGAETHRLAARLVDAGADPIAAQEQLYQSCSPGSMAFLARSLGDAQFAFDQQYCWVSLTSASERQGLIDRDDYRDLIQHLIAVRGVKVAATLIDVTDDNKVRLSLRSRPGYNVEPIMRKFGGGGHAQACGATVTGGSAAEWAERLRNAVGKVLQTKFSISP